MQTEGVDVRSVGNTAVSIETFCSCKAFGGERVGTPSKYVYIVYVHVEQYIII